MLSISSMGLIIIRLMALTLIGIDFVFYCVERFLVKTARFLPATLGLFLIYFSVAFFSDISYLSNGFVYSLYPASQTISSSPRISEFPKIAEDLPAPYVTSLSAIVADRRNDKILYSKNSGVILPPASTTKLMTAIVALDVYDLDETVKMVPECSSVESTKVFLWEGMSYYARDLINAMLVGSAGDAACVLARNKVEYELFLRKMNDKASALGMKSTNFSNPIGLDGDNGEHVSTAEDLYLLAKAAIKDPFIRKAIRTQEYTLTSVNKEFRTKVQNTNKALWEVEGTLGIKTGTTEGAGEVLLYEYADLEKDLVIVVMASSDRFGDTYKLLDWVNEKYSWKLN
ncbi:hypothetical protein A2326_04075 [candidate division WWE3 bacterium RIFOXYB2_FULL_41_6]|nr:MAG: hypothetical protein A2326_04075 [candidate division WWE3 bacterium RIFOXYB2_FULL_41_6]OGC70570.1 MAG: hypothetical protein A2602_02735 [candidate division WWE3 bacterium RIFOXYD1_FULL_40_11]